MAHSVRMQFKLFGKVAGDVTGFNMAGAVVPVSLPIHVDGLFHKTLQFSVDAAQIQAKPVIVQGSITEIGNTAPVGWFDLFTVQAPGLYPVVIPDTLGFTTHEPNLNALRLLSTAGQQGSAIFPASLLVAFEGFWMGDCLWAARNIPYGL